MNTFKSYIDIIDDNSGIMDNDNYLNDILNLVVSVTTNVSHIKICSIWLADNPKKIVKINLRATQSIDPQSVNEHSLTLSQGVVGYVASSRKPLMVEDILNDARFREKTMARKIGLASMLGIPMIDSEDNIIGVLNCFTTTPCKFNEKDVLEMTAIARQAAIIISKTHEILNTRLIKDEINNRDILGRAREVLMQRQGMNSEEADIWFHNYSRQNCKPIRKVAEAILLCR